MSSKNKKQVSKRDTGLITNILLLLVLASVGFLASEYYRNRLEQKEQQERLYSLMESFYGHVWTNDLKEDGRRLAVANRFHAQFDGGKRGLVLEKELLKHGVDGIKAYVALDSRELVNAMGQYASSSSVYAAGLAIAVAAPRSLLNKETLST